MPPSEPKQLFVRTLNFDGVHVQRPINFFVGLNKAGRVATTRLILAHGGHVVPEPGLESSKVIALVDPHAKARTNGRTAYSVDYIQQCVDKGVLLDIEPFRRVPAPSPGRKPAYAAPGASFRRSKRLAKASQETPTEQAANELANNDQGPSAPADEAGIDPADEIMPEPENRAPKRGPQVSAPHMEEAIDSQPEQCDIPAEEADNRTPERTKLAKGGKPTKPGRRVKKGGPDRLAQKSAFRKRFEKRSKKAIGWTPEEDRILFDLYEDVMASYKQHGKDIAALAAIPFWSRMKRQQLLPPAKSAEDCLNRLKACKMQRPRFNGKARRRTPGKRNHTDSDTKSNSLASPDRENASDQEAERVPRTTSAKHKTGDRQPSSDTSSSLVKKPQPQISKKASRKAKASRVVDIIKRLAKHAGVSQRRAFRVLRKEHGNLNKARETLKSKSRAQAT